jgi:hypothetical protein
MLSIVTWGKGGAEKRGGKGHERREAVKRLLDVGQEGWYEGEDRYLGCFVMPMI